jgi:hypothetical protein
MAGRPSQPIGCYGKIRTNDVTKPWTDVKSCRVRNVASTPAPDTIETASAQPVKECIAS